MTGQFYSLHLIHVCRLKAHTQLISWLNKYDSDMGEKQAIYDDILAGFQEEERQMKELKVRETDKLLKLFTTDSIQ